MLHAREFSEHDTCNEKQKTGKKTYTQNGQEKEVKVTAKVMKKVADTEAVAMFFFSSESFQQALVYYA